MTSTSTNTILFQKVTLIKLKILIKKQAIYLELVEHYDDANTIDDDDVNYRKASKKRAPKWNKPATKDSANSDSTDYAHKR